MDFTASAADVLVPLAALLIDLVHNERAAAVATQETEGASQGDASAGPHAPGQPRGCGGAYTAKDQRGTRSDGTKDKISKT
jgi:hypothetical protein